MKLRSQCLCDGTSRWDQIHLKYWPSKSRPRRLEFSISRDGISFVKVRMNGGYIDDRKLIGGRSRPSQPRMFVMLRSRSLDSALGRPSQARSGCWEILHHQSNSPIAANGQWVNYSSVRSHINSMVCEENQPAWPQAICCDPHRSISCKNFRGQVTIPYALRSVLSYSLTTLSRLEPTTYQSYTF